MAPWVMHLRIARLVDEFLRTGYEKEYYVGTVAPDSGKLRGGFDYEPPKTVSHWMRKGAPVDERLALNARFYDLFVKNEKDPARRAFFLGYYVHILADTFFLRDVALPYIEKYTREVWLAKIDGIRDGWYELDFRFLAKNKEFAPLKILSEVKEFPNVYFDYFAPDDISERVEYINRLYSHSKPDPATPLLTLDEESADRFVAVAAREITDVLKKHLKEEQNEE